MLGNFMQQFRGRIQDQIPFINLDALHPQNPKDPNPIHQDPEQNPGVSIAGKSLSVVHCMYAC